MKYRGIIEIGYHTIYKDFDNAQAAANFCEVTLGGNATDHKDEPIELTARIEFINEEDKADE